MRKQLNFCTAHEAMLCGAPVVGLGKGGIKELLENAGN